MFYIYLMRAGDKHYKVGVTRDLAKRVKAIQTSNPIHIDLVASRLVEMPYTAEREVHSQLVEYAGSGGTEWFTMTPERALEVCVYIQSFPHIELSEKVLIKDLLQRQLMWKKTVEKKLDLILNNYQKGVIRTLKARRADDTEPLHITTPTNPVLPADIVQDQDDELMDNARAVIREERKASTSFLQRRLRIGYGRAARIIDELEAEGFITAADGNRPRQLAVNK